MTINERVKYLRKDILKITCENFGKRLGVGKVAISLIERGKNSLTEQNIILICKEFNVNEEWLRTGQGEMFNFVNDEVAEIVSDILEEDNPFFDLILEIMKTYRHLDDK